MAFGSLAPGAVLSIGNFDGIHLGHRRLLAMGRSLRDQHPGARLAIATFEPHPFTVLRPGKVPPRLTPPAIKRDLLAKQGVDDLIELAPEPAILDLSAENFWEILRDQVRPSHLIEGNDFNFGKARAGNIQRLREWAAGSDVTLHVAEDVEAPLLDLHVVPVSSTLIRWLLARRAACATAAICLGRGLHACRPCHQRPSARPNPGRSHRQSGLPSATDPRRRRLCRPLRDRWHDLARRPEHRHAADVRRFIAAESKRI